MEVDWLYTIKNNRQAVAKSNMEVSREGERGWPRNT